MKNEILNIIFAIVGWLLVVCCVFTEDIEGAIFIMLLLIHNKINDISKWIKEIKKEGLNNV